jgi:Flp pilus assembly protein TadD
MNIVHQSRRTGVAGAMLLLAVLAVPGCGTPGKARPTARMEIQADVGFVITEEARISSDVRADYERAVRLLEQGEAEQGIELLTKAAEQAPLLSAPHIDLGIALRRAGEFAAAEEHLENALAANPEHPVAHNELGILYRQTGRFAEARRSYEAALAIYPGFHFARRNLGVLCDLYLGDLACALEQYGAYLQKAPNDEEAAMWMADVRNRLEP